MLDCFAGQSLSPRDYKLGHVNACRPHAVKTNLGYLLVVADRFTQATCPASCGPSNLRSTGHATARADRRMGKNSGSRQGGRAYFSLKIDIRDSGK